MADGGGSPFTFSAELPSAPSILELEQSLQIVPRLLVFPLFIFRRFSMIVADILILFDVRPIAVIEYV